MSVAEALPTGYSPMMISAKQIRAARALIGWTQADLAKAAGLSIAALNNLEREVTDPRGSTLNAIETALREGGVEIISDRGHSPDGGPGVRLVRR